MKLQVRSSSLAFVCLHLAGLALAIFTLGQAWQSLLLPILFGGNAVALTATLGLVAVLAAVAAGSGISRWRRGVPETDAAVRLLGLAQFAIGCVLVIALVLDLKTALAAQIAAVFAYGLYVLWTWSLAPMRRWVPAGLRRVAFVAGINLLVTVVLAEAALRAAALVWPNPILATTSTPEHIRRVADRSPPGTVRFGFPVNKDGHYDTDFAARGELSGPLVVSIGDSFAYGVVPHALHFTTIAEQQFRDVEISNMGFPGIGVRDYRYLLEHEARPLKPDLVVIHLFLGNDLTDGAQIGTPAQWFTADNYMTTTVLQRLHVLSRERQAGLASATEHVAVTRSELLTQFPWLSDPMQEAPRFSKELFLNIETERARAVAAPVDVIYQRFFEELDQLERVAGDVPLAFVLMPDEFQVDDELWQEVTAATGPLDRDRPQREIVQWLQKRGRPVLDLLPIFRAAEPLADGRRHLFHLRDTHTNARGNEIAGRALARFIEPLLPPRATLPLTVDFGNEGNNGLREGWHDAESSAGRSFAWSEGDRSVLEVALPNAHDVQMTLECQPFVFPGAPPQRVSIVVNGKAVEELRLRPEWGRYAVRLPKEALAQPLNRLEFRYAYSRSPARVIAASADRRPLAVAWYSIAFSSDGAQPLMYRGRASDRTSVRGGFTMTIDVKGAEPLVSQIRQSNIVLGLQELRVEGEGERFVTGTDAGAIVMQTRMDRVQVTGIHASKPFEFKFDRHTPPGDIEQDQLRRIAWGLGLAGRRFKLGRHGEYAILDDEADAGGEAMGVIVDTPVRLLDRPVRVGETWTTEWSGDRKAPETEAVFRYRQTARFEDALEGGAVARISFTTTGTMDIDPERNAGRGEATTMEARGTLLLDLRTGQIVGLDTAGAITSSFAARGFSLVRGFKANYQRRAN